MKCLACGQENNAGDEACTSCSASLDLKLCSACEAIHPPQALYCPNCGARTSLPSTWVIAGEPAARPGRFKAVLWLVPVLAAAGIAYHFAAGVSVARPIEIPLAEPKVAPRPVLEQVSEEPAKTAVVAQPPAAPARVTAPKVVPRVTHTRVPESAAGGATAVHAR